MMTFVSQISFLLLLLLSATIIHITMSSNHRVVRCNEKDQQTLLTFKQGVIDAFNRLSTWSSHIDCCAWKGVQCDNVTGRVIKLDLNRNIDVLQEDVKPLQGKINLSLLELEFLNYLDLSVNQFEGISFPPNSGNITLDSSLRYLDLSFSIDLIDNLDWLSRLSSLKYLNLCGIDLQKETNWLQLVATLPSLSELYLIGCQLTNISPSLKYVNFTSLVTLGLSMNNFDSELPQWLFNLTSEISLVDLSGCGLHGTITSSLFNQRSLEDLDLSQNKLKGSIPNWLGQHEHLQYLDLSHNLFSGFIPSTLGNLSSLIELRIGFNHMLRGNLPNSRNGKNSLKGVPSEMIFSKLFNLEVLDLRHLTFAFDFDREWIPPFQLRHLYLGNTNQGPNFPSWIYTQKSLEILDISSSVISSVDGDKFWNFVSGIKHLDLSKNSIGGYISNVSLNCIDIDLGHNNFTGSLPHMSVDVVALDVSFNSFSGSIPDGLENWKILSYMNLRNNRLSGELPLDLSNLTKLQFMDLGENEFSGTMPIKMPRSLRVLILRSNQFGGNIPQQLCNLPFMYQLDLAHNKFSGSIPQCVSNITDMVVDSRIYVIVFSFDWFTKGQKYEYMDRGKLRNIDLSSNNLTGEIPSELFKLVQVQAINLSYNHLTGRIPKTIEGMKNLESLDLSNNEFFGEIPHSMAALTFLAYLNLSYNNFSGQIPTGTQLQSFDAWSYIGNPELCGAPLMNCTEEHNSENAKPRAEYEDGDPERKSFYLGMGVGFAVGFWGVCGSLFLNRRWRHIYFRFLNHVADRVYVAIALKFRNFRGIGANSN